MIDIDDTLLIVDIAQGMRLHRQLPYNLFGMTAKNHHFAKVLFKVAQLTTGLNEIRHPLVLVGHPLRGEENQFLILWQTQSLTGLLFVAFPIDMRVDGVGNAGNLLAFEQGTRLRLRFQPSATSHKVNIPFGQHLLFFPPDT